MYRELIDKYIDYASEHDMELLADEVDAFVACMHDKHREDVEKLLCHIDLILNPEFTRETAKYAVAHMKNKDGSTGEHWSHETTTNVMESHGYHFNPCDWYYVMNMVYSDYYKPGRSDDTYIEMAHDFLDDKDALPHKAKRYYKAMTF